MQNFELHNPTHIVFGKDTIPKLSELIDKKDKVLILYGGGSVKKNGVFDAVMKALKGYKVVEFGGIEANPEYETCKKAMEVVKKEKIDFLLSVGGGSVLDATKFISAGAYYTHGDSWEILDTFGAHIDKVVPIGSVITMPATGSEMNGGAVISKRADKAKKFFINQKTYPRFSIIDPETTYSLPERQILNGIVDTYIHTLEGYMMDKDTGSYIHDGYSEAILRSTIRAGKDSLRNKKDYNARANLFWCATSALNGIAMTHLGDWSTHHIGHGITAEYGLDHGQTLAILQFGVWEFNFDIKKRKLAQYAENVFGVTGGSETDRARKAIKLTEELFNEMGMKTRLSDYGIDVDDAKVKLPEYCKRTYGENFGLGEIQNIDAKAVVKIMELRK